MAKRRRTTRRAGKSRPITVSNPISAATEVRAAKAPAQRPARRAKRDLSIIDAGQFLSPEQQYLLRVRREAERREAKRQWARAGVALVGIVGVATAMAWLSGWI